MSAISFYFSLLFFFLIEEGEEIKTHCISHKARNSFLDKSQNFSTDSKGISAGSALSHFLEPGQRSPSQGDFSP